jgi:hypothetical protein
LFEYKEKARSIQVVEQPGIEGHSYHGQGRMASSFSPSCWTLIGGSVIIIAVAVRSVLELINRSRPQQTPSLPV